MTFDVSRTLSVFVERSNHGMHAAFGISAGLAVYACLFTVMGRAAFPDAPSWSRAPAFLMPVGAFLVAVWWRRDKLRLVAEAERPFDLDHLPRMARWLLPIWAIGVFSLALPVNRLPVFDQGTALLGAMAIISIIVAASVGGVVLLLVVCAWALSKLKN